MKKLEKHWNWTRADANKERESEETRMHNW